MDLNKCLVFPHKTIFNQLLNKSTLVSLHLPSLLHAHQSVLLLAEDHLVIEVSVSKVLCYGEAAQAVTRVVEVSRSGNIKASQQCTNDTHEHNRTNPI